MEKTGPIALMQEYLSILRKIKGWTTEELGNRIGVTKQTISNLENYKVNMTKTQYIALRSVFEYEINCNEKSSILRKAMYILFYSDVEWDDSIKERIKEALDNLAAAASGGISGQQLKVLSITLLSPLKLPVLSETANIKAKPYMWLAELEDEYNAKD